MCVLDVSNATQQTCKNNVVLSLTHPNCWRRSVEKGVKQTNLDKIIICQCFHEDIIQRNRETMPQSTELLNQHVIIT